MSNMHVKLTSAALEGMMLKSTDSMGTLSLDPLPHGKRYTEENSLWKVKHKLNLVEMNRDELNEKIAELEVQLSQKNAHIKELESYEAIVYSREKVAFGAEAAARDDDPLEEVNRQLSECVEYLKINTKLRRYFSTLAPKKDKKKDGKESRRKPGFVPVVRLPYRPKSVQGTRKSDSSMSVDGDIRKQQMELNHQNAIKALETTIGVLESKAKGFEKRLDHEVKASAMMKDELNHIEHAHKILKEEFGKGRGKIAKLEQDNETLQAEVKKWRHKASGMKDDLGPMEKANMSMSFQLKEIDIEIERLNLEVKKRDKKIFQMESNEKEHVQEIKYLTTRVMEREEEITGGKVKLERKREKKRKYKQAAMKCRAEIKELQLTLATEREKGQAAFNEFNTKTKKLDQQLSKVTNGYRKKAQDAELAATEADQLDRMKKSHEREMKRMQAEIDDLVVLLDRARAELHSLYNELDEKNLITEKLDDEVDDTRAHAAREKKKVMRKLDEVSHEYTVQERELARVAKENVVLTNNLARSATENNALLQQLQRAHKFFNAEKVENEDNQAQLLILDRNLQKARLENERLQQKITKMSTQIRRMGEQLESAGLGLGAPSGVMSALSVGSGMDKGGVSTMTIGSSKNR